MGISNINYRELSDEEFTEKFRVTPADFQGMLPVLHKAIKFSRNKILLEKALEMPIEHMLLLTFEYLLGNHNIMDLGKRYNIYYNHAREVIDWVIYVLDRNGLSTKLPVRSKAAAVSFKWPINNRPTNRKTG